MKKIDLNPVIHERTRLQILTMFLQTEKLSFNEIKTTLGISDGNLASHLRILEREGYIKVEKTFVNRRPRTYYSLTEKGKKEFLEYLSQLEAFLKEISNIKGSQKEE